MPTTVTDPGPFRGRVLLAPLAGYTDAAFRSVCRSLGADLAFTEMISSEALVREHPKTRSMLERDEGEREFAIQLFGSSPETMARAARIVAGQGPVLIDVNCGCPVPKIVRNGGGSELMREPERIGRIVRAMRDELDRFADETKSAPIPVSVKIRSGWDDASVNYLEAAGIAVRAGAKAVTLHARTRAQGYAGKADWSHIRALAEALPVPVAGSGDAFTAEACAAMLAETGCAAVMIARGAVGNPFIFRATKALLEGRPIPEVAIHERVDAARRHFALAVRFLGERVACREFRKQLCAYTKGTRSGAILRREVVRGESAADFGALFDTWETLAGQGSDDDSNELGDAGLGCDTDGFEAGI